MPDPLVSIGGIIQPFSQAIAPGTCFGMLQLNPQGPPAPTASFGKAIGGPWKGRLASASNKIPYINYENFIAIANAGDTAVPPQNYAKQGFCFRMNPRIDKYPWPHGQQYVNVLIIVSYQDGVGGTGGRGPTPPSVGCSTFVTGSGGAFGSVAFAPDVAYILQWPRNTTFTATLSSGVTPPNANVQTIGFPSGNSVALRFQLTSRNFTDQINGQLTQEDTRVYDPSFIQLDVDNPNFSFTGTRTTAWSAPPDPQPHVRLGANNFGQNWQPHPPCLSGTQIFPPGFPSFFSSSNLGNFFTRSTFNPPAIGLVQACSWLVAAWGWSTEVNDSGTTG